MSTTSSVSVPSSLSSSSGDPDASAASPSPPFACASLLAGPDDLAAGAGVVSAAAVIVPSALRPRGSMRVEGGEFTLRGGGRRQSWLGGGGRCLGGSGSGLVVRVCAHSLLRVCSEARQGRSVYARPKFRPEMFRCRRRRRHSASRVRGLGRPSRRRVPCLPPPRWAGLLNLSHSLHLDPCPAMAQFGPATKRWPRS